jgi:hypothetical protein
MAPQKVAFFSHRDHVDHLTDAPDDAVELVNRNRQLGSVEPASKEKTTILLV